MKRVLAMPVYAIAMCFVALPANACTCALPTYQVMRTFHVLVKSTLGLTGVEVKLIPEAGTNLSRYSARVDQRRTATFRNVAAGRNYVLSFEPDSGGGLCGGAILEVGDTGETAVTLAWSDVSVLRSRSLTGRLTFDGVRVPNLSADVFNVRTGTIVERGIISEDGKFAFAIRPGLYALQLRQEQGSRFGGIEGDLLFLIEAAAASDKLDVQVGASTCGFIYGANCPTIQGPTATISEISGEVVDASGAVIPRADVLVLARGNTILRTTTDFGKFVAAGIPPGDYDVQIHAIGFHTIRTQVKVAVNAGTQGLVVTMAMAGSCGGAVTLRNPK